MGGDAPAAAVFCSGPQSRGQNFIRAPSKQIHIFAPGILLAVPAASWEPFLGDFLNTKTKAGLVPGEGDVTWCSPRG